MSDYAEFLGPTFTRPIANIQVQSERCVNWRLEQVPGKGKSPFILLRQPGLRAFCDTGLNARVRGMFSLNGHQYAVVGSHYIEILSNGTFIDYSVLSGVFLTDDGNKAWITANPTQQLIVSGGNGYISEAGAIHLIADPDFPQGQASACEFMDGYFVVTIINSQQFQISGLNDGNSWAGDDISSVESRPDFLVAPIQLREEMWFFGNQLIQPFFDTGAPPPTFPWSPNQSAIINTGLMSAQSLIRIGNILFWLELDENGHGIFCRNNGYDRLIISNRAIESLWNTYSNLNQTYCWGYQENGHICCRVNFQNTGVGSGSSSFEYDMSTSQWTEVPYWNSALAQEEAHRGYCSSVAFDKILVGDRSNGIIYELNSSFLDDDGAVIRRVRRTPHLYSERKRICYSRFELDGNKGIGIGNFGDPYYNPKGILNFSDNGGKSFSQMPRDIYFGEEGNYDFPAFAQGLNSAKNRVFEFVVTAPVDWAITAARLDYEVLDD